MSVFDIMLFAIAEGSAAVDAFVVSCAVTEENIAGNTVAVGGATLFLAGEFCAHLSFFFLLTIEPYKL